MHRGERAGKALPSLAKAAPQNRLGTGNREKTRYLWAFEAPKWKKPHKMRLKRYFSTAT